MRRGDRLRVFAAWLFDAGTMARVIDPAIADLQAEPASFSRYFAVVKVLALCLPEVAMKPGAVSILAAAALALVVAAFELRPLVFAWSQGAFEPRMLAYLLPQSAAIAVVIALTVGIVAACGGHPVSRGTIVRVLVLALAVSAASFVNAGWLTPAANQKFRVAFLERTQPAGPPPQRGFNELTLTEVHRQYAVAAQNPAAVDSTDLHYLAVSYHGRWALTVAPVVFAMFALLLATLPPVPRWTAGLGASTGYIAYLLYMDVPNLPALDGGWLGGAAWYPELALVVAIVLLSLTHRRQTNAVAG
jgi:hypothetical protein